MAPRPLRAPSGEDPAYLSRQLITYIGNKRALLGRIAPAVDRVKRRLGAERLRVFDAFSGSGVVSRFFKAHASYLASNDLEEYAAAAGRCYLRNRRDADLEAVSRVVADLNARVDSEPLPRGFIEELYAPRDDRAVARGERAFYTRANARRIDNYRRLIEASDAAMRDLLLGPLLSEASIHANTAGVFKGFYKDARTRIGRFGGSNSDALSRIMGEIRLDVPVLSRFSCECEVLREDANAAARRLRNLDLAYLDPPYNQHPYGSNYFMLNLIARYERPERVSRVSGIPADWRRSGYNVRARALPLLRDLVAAVDAPFLLVSYNDEGFIPPGEMRAMLQEAGRVETFETRYNAFRGSRSFAGRTVHVKELLYLVERR